MSNKFKLIIRTPEKEVFSGEVESIYVSTDLGDTEIHPNHSSIGAAISYSPIILNISKDLKIEFIIKRGMFSFSNDKNEALLMAYSAQKREEIDFDSAKEYLKYILEKLESGKYEDAGSFTFKFLEDEKIALIKEFDLD